MNELQKIDNSIIDWECQSQLKTIKDIYAKKATNEEFATFINIGRATGLNPFLREIWLVKYGDSPAAIFIGRDGYRKSAQQNPNYDYHTSDAVYSNDTFKISNGEVSHEYTVVDRGILLGAYCAVKRKSSSKAIFVYVELKEYDKGQSNWKTMKATMIKKVAEAQCLRMAFQEIFAGTYDESEYEPQDNSKSANIKKSDIKIRSLIEGKSEKLPNINDILTIIAKAETLDDLKCVLDLVKGLPENEKEQIKPFYKERKLQLTQVNQETGEIIEEKDIQNDPPTLFEKIKKQLEIAKSRDTLDIAVDLVSQLESSDERKELLALYAKRKDEVK